MPRPIVIGAGHNALVAAFHLARAGLRPLVLEARDAPGGQAATTEIHPGFRVPTLTHAVALAAEVAEEMGLAALGVQVLAPDPVLFAPARDGRALVLHRSAAASAEALKRLSARDAARYVEFQRALEHLGEWLGDLLRDAPPSIDDTSAGDLWGLLKTGRRFHALGPVDAYRLLRWMPMPVADLADEWFESEPLRAAVAARGIFGTRLGPRSAGSAANLLLQATWDPHPTGALVTVKGGPGALTAAMAAAVAGAGGEIRCGARVTAIETGDDGVTAVRVEGERIETDLVVSGAGPKVTLLDLVDPVRLGPSFRATIAALRSEGTTAKVNLALDGLPPFPAAERLYSTGGPTAAKALGGRIHIGPTTEYLERAFDAAKYGQVSAEPWLDVTIPSLADPSLAPDGRHVLSAVVHYAPRSLREGDWTWARDGLLDLVVRTLAGYAPELPSRILAREAITPADLESGWHLAGGHIHHGEHALDQMFLMRPALGWAQYRMPVRGLYLCGAGTHPGGGVTGLPGSNAAKTILKELKRR